MTVAERKAICEMLVRMERQKEFSKKIGLVDTSAFNRVDCKNNKKHCLESNEK